MKGEEMKNMLHLAQWRHIAAKGEKAMGRNWNIYYTFDLPFKDKYLSYNVPGAPDLE